MTIPADKLNGTFAYSAEKPEDQGKLTYDVTSIEKRKEGLDLKTALVWKDATAAENKIWPEAAENIYDSNDPMTIYTPKSPWGAMEAKTVTVTVPAW